MNAIIAAIGVLLAAVTFLLTPLEDALAGIPFIGTLALLSSIDFRERLLPDILILPLLLLGLGLSLIGIGPAPLASASGAAIGWAGLAALAYFYRRFRGYDGLGLGDAKLLGALGAWCGIVMIPSIVFTGASFALLYYFGSRLSGARVSGRDELPFGPFLALGGWCAFVIARGETQTWNDLLAVIKMS